ncbi:hypothetical protein AG1IA_00405 [Rhizoctonia solani AG-1 IA]|uniref:Uncharacterized protein n=1 Tax=Thanatephorus cucumeris (strain AG1-IA) TaxID=983506 RepID=L8X8V9_THACA|nr:hypothetical protein AG1IA_00405 [Rhizoctonia solani AG-1 IA]
MKAIYLTCKCYDSIRNVPVLLKFREGRLERVGGKAGHERQMMLLQPQIRSLPYHVFDTILGLEDSVKVSSDQLAVARVHVDELGMALGEMRKSKKGCGEVIIRWDTGSDSFERQDGCRFSALCRPAEIRFRPTRDQSLISVRDGVVPEEDSSLGNTHLIHRMTVINCCGGEGRPLPNVRLGMCQIEIHGKQAPGAICRSASDLPNRIPSASVPWSPPLFFPAHSRCAHTALRRPYKIEIGVSFAGKPALDAQQLPKKKTIAFSRDHPIAQWRNGLLKWENKKLRSVSAGEDFFYVTQELQTGLVDGVKTVRVDPSLFSQALMYYASKHASSSWAGEPDFDPIEGTSKPEKSGQSLSPVDIMSLGYEDVLNDPSIECGEKIAHSVYCKHRCPIGQTSSSQTRAFQSCVHHRFSTSRNPRLITSTVPGRLFLPWCPKITQGYGRQLAKLLPTQRPHLRITDRPEHADTFSTQLRHEDLIILSVRRGFDGNPNVSDILCPKDRRSR